MTELKQKIWIGWLAFLFIVIHFVFILAYALPPEFSNSSLKSFATPYVEPVFTQHWSMFAPCPITNASVEIKFYFDGNDSTDWVSPTEDARNIHGWLKGTHHGELVLAESNLMYWLGLDLDRMGIEIGDPFPLYRTSEFQQGYSYFKIKDYIEGNALYLYDKEVVHAKIRCDLEDVVTGERGVLELPEFYF